MSNLRRAADLVIKTIPNPDNALAIWPQCTVFWGRFQVGELEGFSPDDPVITNRAGAVHLAKKLSAKETGDFYDVAYGVWEQLDAGTILMAICYRGEEYT